MGRLTSGSMLVGWITLAALLFRIVLAVTTPPWQGPDEPKHFEYVRRLIDLRDQLWSEHRLLRLEDASPDLQRQIIRSMEAHHFWRYAGPVPTTPPDSFYDL